MSIEFVQIQKSLKAAIKSKGMTYKDLAKKISMSEAGVKRLLNSEDCSLQRLLKICGVIEVSLSDLIAISQQVDEEVQNFTSEQIQLFSDNPHYLKYYYKLRVERCSPQEIQNDWQMSEGETQKILNRLDKVQLIELLPENKIGGLGRRNVYWKNLGPAFLQLKYDFTLDLVNYFRTRQSNNKGYFPFYHLRMSEKSRENFYRDLNDLVEKYAQQSDLDGIALKPENIHPLNIAFLLAPTKGFSQQRPKN